MHVFSSFVVSLKNAAMLLEFAAVYNAEQLKQSCLQFIGLNMAALLEARYVGAYSIWSLQKQLFIKNSSYINNLKVNNDKF